MGKKYYVGIDLGGTSIKAGIVSTTGELLAEREQPTPRGPYQEVLHTFREMIHSLAQDLSISMGEIGGVGVGAPALLDVKRGYVHEIVNLGWHDVPLKEELESLLKLPCYIDNDANTAALGEMWKGAGRGAQHLICITVGTGIGGGLILNGDIYHGVIGLAGEIGHLTVRPEDGRLCNCGNIGCLETETSATAMIHYGKQVLKTIEQVTAKDVIDAAKDGNEQCLQIVQRVGYYLGLSLAQAANLFNPEKIVIGGGVSKAGEFFLQPIREQFNKFALKKVAEVAQIVPAELGNRAGMIGSAWLAHKHSE
jgi:glucokinase